MMPLASFLARGFAAIALLTTFSTGVAQPVPILTLVTNGDIVTDVLTNNYSCAWADYDNDGLPDQFRPGYSGTTNVLYHNNGDGTFTKVTQGNLVDFPGVSYGCAWGDFDNDGFLDLFLANQSGNPNFLFRNNGNGTFTRITPADSTAFAGNSVSCAWADYDNDGFLDLVVAPATDPAQNNYLLRNNHDGTFTRIARGPSGGSGWNSLGCAWADYDNDGRRDLLIANINHENFLYHNDGGGTFSQVGSGSFPADSGAWYGVSWGDYNNDGYLDLFLADSKPGTANALYRNNTNGTFTRMTGAGFPFAGPSAGCAWGDFNNDGFLDLFVAGLGGGATIYLNQGNGTFGAGISLNHPGGANAGCDVADYDRDGFLDVYVSHEPSGLLYHNNGNGNHWTTIKCVGVSNNAAGIGAKIKVTATIQGVPRQQLREITSGSGYGGQNGLTAHFGLGGAVLVSLLRIEWPTGAVQTFTNLPADQFLTVNEITGVTNVFHSISGRVDYAGLGSGPVIVTATLTNSVGALLKFTSRAQWPSAPDFGFNTLPDGFLGNLTAFLDINHNGQIESWEPRGDYALNPFVLTNNLAGANIALAQPLPPEGDADADGLQNQLELQAGTNPTVPDTDGDGLTDYEEIFVYGTNPLSPNTDGDGMPDEWEVDHGLNPLVNDASDDADFDGVSNIQEYQYGLSHTNQLDPRNLFSQPGISDYAAFTGGQIANRFFYDRKDRLLGEESSRGLSFAYVYDGNDNLVRQTALSRASETNGLPALWRFLNGLTNNASPYADSDGDGWSNYQEWKAETNPLDANSVPDILGLPGTNIASLSLPFTPSNFVVGVGQLDGLGAEEIVIGADGNPGTNVNVLLVLTQASPGWSTQRVDVGAFGITSIAVGQPNNTTNAAIYIGTRIAGGTGTVMEVKSVSNIWQKTFLSSGNTGEVAYVLGVRPDYGVLAQLSRTDAPDQSLFSATVSPGNSWSAAMINTNTSHRGLGTVPKGANDAAGSPGLRLLDVGGIQVGYRAPDPAYLPSAGLVLHLPFDGDANDTSENRFIGTIVGATATADRFGDENTAYSFDGNDYVSIPDSDYWAFGTSDFTVALWARFSATNSSILIGSDNGGGTQNKWLLIYEDGQLRFHVNTSVGPPNYPVEAGFAPTLGRWYHVAVTRSGNTFTIYVDGTPAGVGGSGVSVPNAAAPLTIGQAESNFYMNGAIDDVRIYNRSLTAQELAATAVALNPVMLQEPTATSILLWRGHSLASGSARQRNSLTICYSFVDDKNTNSVMEPGDDFVVAEYAVNGTNVTLLTLSRQTMTSPTLAQSYGLASVNLLNTSNEVFFTGEPDGQVFAWTATGATNPLQRQLFSGHHAGKTWHALAGVKTLEAGEGLVGLRVDPTSPARCDVIFWPPQTSLPQLPKVPQTAPLAAILPATNTLLSLAAITARLWDAEGNAATPFVQFQVFGTTNWTNAAIVSVDASPYNPSVRVAASPSGINHALVWDALADLGPNVATNVLLRARAQDITLLGNWSVGTQFQVNTAANPDADGDGLPDWWEDQYLGGTAANPNDDPDGDGFKNWQEYTADTNPTNTASLLTLSVSLLSEGVRLGWLAGSNSWKYLQRAISLTETNAAWFNIWTSPPPPSPDSGSFTDSFGTNTMQFYRMKATR